MNFRAPSYGSRGTTHRASGGQATLELRGFVVYTAISIFANTG